ncbi:hypothetical protein [Streptomyces wuyuanensis]|uniref:Uncharacterized protein n=1 Tax=Streptomyces wuyuanensis TaxID=1196353 RepID=A0A1G9S4W5_9ACTN|nr:hypothetical protein [Streptomyces wuyuanensis]SDM30442.1 hypothetical protein SAMN05444921_106176 [Streptomyces wuyuanensis]
MDQTVSGPVVRLDHPMGIVEVSGSGLPPVRIVRSPGTEPHPHIPVGTRDRALLTLTVDGAPARIAPGRGRLLRGSYRVDAFAGSTRYRLVPCSLDSSRFLRDGVPLGTFTSEGDGHVGSDGLTDAGAQPRDIAVGTALAAAFGTGGQPWWATALDAVAELIP